LHVTRTCKWLNNANTWILSTSRCNHDVKFIENFGKDNKSLIYYIININLDNVHVFFLTNCNTKNIKILLKTKTHTMLLTKVVIWSYNVWIQLEVNKKYQPLNQLFICKNLLDHLIDYNFTFIPWYSLSSWVNEHKIN
jgi:hypothetical protein